MKANTRLSIAGLALAGMTCLLGCSTLSNVSKCETSSEPVNIEETPIAQAIRDNRTDQLAQLRREGQDFKARGVSGETYLHWAASDGNVRACEALIQAGLDINATTIQGLTPLWCAVGSTNRSAVELLLKHGARVDLANSGGRTPLRLACYIDSPEIVALLLKYGADPFKHDKSGISPYDDVVRKGKTALKTMIEEYADAKVR